MQVSDSGAFGAADLGGSALDREVDLTAVSWYLVGWLAVVALAVGIRVAGLTAWPLSPGEAGIASDAYSLVHGGAISAAGAAHPMPAHLAAASFFVFGAGDGAARLIPLLAGITAIILVWPLRDVLGRGGSLCAALIAALSPALTQTSERLDGAALLTASSLLLILTLRRAGRRPGFGIALLLGSVAALLPLSHPLGWIALPLIGAIGLVLVPIDERPSAEALPWAALGFASALLLISTSLLTRPGGLTHFFGESFGALWHQEIARAGHLWQLPLFELVIDELPALVFAAVGLALARRADRRPTVLAWWTAAALLIATLLGAKELASYALVALPLALLGGTGLTWLFAWVDWDLFTEFSGAGFAVALVASIAAALSAAGVIFDVSNSSMIDALIKFVLLVVVILAPLSLLTVRLGRGLRASPWPVVALAGVVVLLGLSLRSSTLLAATNVPRAGSILTAGSTSPDVGSLVDRLRTVSRDLTDLNQSAIDPTGGHGLTIAVDSSMAQPFRWYFRDFPSLQVTQSATTVTPAPQVVITSAAPAAADGRVVRTFALQTQLPSSIAHPNWGRLAVSIFDPVRLRGFAGFLIDHQVLNPEPPRQFTLSLSPDVGQRLFGASPQP